MCAVVWGPGEGEHLAAGAASLELKATGEDTAGSFFLSETTVPPGFPGPPPHYHEKLHDMFYVLEGTITVLVNGATRELGAGSFVCVPPGDVHTFSNPGDQPARVLNFNTPAGWEHYMRDLAAALAEGEVTSEKIGEIASRYDFHVAT